MHPATAGGLNGKQTSALHQQQVILCLIFRVKALRAPHHHFSYESQDDVSFSNAARLVQGWVRTSTKANILPRVLGARALSAHAAAVAP